MSTARPAAAEMAPIHYAIDPADLHGHRFAITLTVAEPAAEQILALPVWIPGSYLVREFAKNLQNLRARQGRKAVALTQLDKHRWQADCRPGQALVLEYEVCAYDRSVRTAWLDADRGFFNSTSLCLQVVGQTDRPCTIDLVAPKKRASTAHWMCATGLFSLKIDAQGFGRYQAQDYDELADCPVEMGTFWSGEFTAGGIPHRFVVAGAPASFDGARLLADTREVCEAAIRFWHGKGKPPHQNYLFMLNAVHDGYGGLEHRNSTALICKRSDLPRLGEASASEGTNDGYTQLLGLISHEYFHTWNVKRLRPIEFARYDYAQENYTQLLWFFEGFTSYYDDLLLRRAGLLDDAGYLKLLGKTIQQVQQTPGRQVQTVAKSSFDAWVKYYRQDENTPNSTISYYTKGALVALCLDLTLRREGQTTLDAVMRGLWQRCKAGPMAESDLCAVLQALAGRSFDAELDAWVHSTSELPLAELLTAHGVALENPPPTWAQRLGLRVQENHSVQVKTVLRGSPAELAGMAAGDEWLGVEIQGQGWRLQKLDELALYAGQTTEATALVARDGRLLHLPLRWENAPSRRKAIQKPMTSATTQLKVGDAVKVQSWLQGELR